MTHSHASFSGGYQCELLGFSSAEHATGGGSTYGSRTVTSSTYTVTVVVARVREAV